MWERTAEPWRVDIHPGHRPAFLIHDPALAKYAWIQMKHSGTKCGRASDSPCLSLEQMLLAPNVWAHAAKFDATLLVTYTGAPR